MFHNPSKVNILLTDIKETYICFLSVSVGLLGYDNVTECKKNPYVDPTF